MANRGFHFPVPADEPHDPLPDLLAVLRERAVQTHLLIDTSRPIPAAFRAGWDSVREHPNTAATLEAAGELLAGLPAESSWLVWLELGALLPPWKVPDDILDAYFAHLRPEELADDEEDDDDDDGHVSHPADDADDEPPGDILEAEEQLDPLMDPPTGRVDPADDELYLRVQKSYAAAISHLDILLANLLDGMPDDVLVVLTADCGQSLAEHGMIGDLLPSLHAEVVQVPLLFAGAGCRPGRHVGALTASVDIAPTIAELAGGRLPGAHGHSLVALLGDNELAPWPYVALGTESAGQVAWGLWTAERTLLVPTGTDSARMFVKPDDRSEVNDIRQHELERAEALERTLHAFVAASAGPGPLVLPREEEPA